MPKKEKLPPGWLKRESNTYPGKFYYFHKETRRTTWLLPTDEEIIKTESKECNCSNVGTSKTPAKTQRKSLSVKEKQESMVPRAVRQICTPSSSVRGPKKILNVSVLNRNNCSLVADYSSCSDGEEEQSKSKKKKDENEKKTKQTNVSLPSLTERTKVQMKWKAVGPSISQPSSKLVLRREQNATKSKDIVSSSVTKKYTKSCKKTVKSKKPNEKLKKIIPPSELSGENLESKNSCLKVPRKKITPKKVSSKDDKPKKNITKNLKTQETTNEKSLGIKPSPRKKSVVKPTGKKKKKAARISANVNKDFDEKKQKDGFPQVALVPSEQFLPVVPEIKDSNLVPIFEESNTSFNNQNISTSSSFHFFSDNHPNDLEDFSQPMEVDSCPDSDMIDYIVKLRRDMSNERFNMATGDLTKHFEMDTSSSINVTTTQPQVTYVVLDTNALVNDGDLVLIKKICDGKYTAEGHLPYIIIPWVVMQELDVLKSRRKQKPVTGESAQRAILFLSTYFRIKHPRVIGQTLKEAMQLNEYLVAENNDDKILQCCMQFESKYPHSTIILYSNDVNLCNKTLINGIAAFNKASIRSGLSSMSGNSTDNCDQKRRESYSPPSSQRVRESYSPPSSLRVRESYSPNSSQRVPSDECNNDKPQPTKVTPSQLSLVTQIFNRLKVILKRVLGLVLETEMKDAFNDVWLKIIKVQPPWELNDILYCYIEHWYAVFGQIYTNRKFIENKYRNLSEYFSSKKGFNQKPDFVSSKMDECNFVLEPLLSKNPVYKDEVKCSVESIEILQRICADITAEQVDANSSLDEILQQQQQLPSAKEEQVEIAFSTEFSMSIALAKFQKVWEMFNSYCQEVECTLQSGASPETCQRVLAALQTSIPMMEIIYNQFSSCLGLSSADILKEINMFTVLAEQLNAILPHLGCQDNAPLVNCGHLQTLFSNPEKREMLSNGLAQLEIMIRGLHTYQGHLMGT